MEVNPIQNNQQLPVLALDTCMDPSDQRCMPRPYRMKRLSRKVIRPMVSPSKHHPYYETGAFIDIYA